MIISVILLCFPACSFAFWSRNTNDISSIAHTQDPDPNTIDLSKEDANVLQINKDALQAYSRKPDCFKKAANFIRGRCEDSDMDEESRVSAAISMTLCEVATAKHYSFPLECQPYSFQTQLSEQKTIPSGMQGQCVDALSRSAQLWSSYSGYMREIPQLCHTFRRWNDIDLARNIYYNVTVEKLALIRFIFDREKTSKQLAEELFQTQKEISQITTEMKLLQERQRVDGHSLTLRLKEDSNDILTKFWALAQQVISRKEIADVDSANQFEVVLFSTLQNHSDALRELVDSLSPMVASRLDAIYSSYELRLQSMNQLGLEIQTQWTDMGMSFAEMKHAILQISDQAAQTSESLELSIRGTKDIWAIQAEAALAASDLVKTLTQLTDYTSVELHKINGSVYHIGQQLQSQVQRASQPWKSYLVQVFELIYRADPGSLAYLEQLFSFRLLLTLLGFVWTAARTTVSTAAAFSVLVFLSTRKVFKRKSMEIFIPTLDYQASPVSKHKEIYLPGTLGLSRARPSTLLLPGDQMRNSDETQYRKRVSRIPDRLCFPSTD